MNKPDTIPIHILLVEDNPDDALLIREMLSETVLTEYHLEWVERLSGARQCLDEHGASVDMVLLDLALPDSRGIDTLSAVRNHVPHVPIVVLTALGHEELGRKAIHEGAQDYICKSEMDAVIMENSLRFAIERHQLLMELENRKIQLAESERLTRRIIEKNADGIVIINRQGRVMYINPAARGLTGKEPGEAMNRIARDILSHIGAPEPGESIELTIEPDTCRGEPAVVEMRVARIEWQGEPAFLVSLRDITERKQLEKSLLIEKERLDISLRSIADGVITTDRSGLVLSINQAAGQMLGLTREQTAGRAITRLLAIRQTGKKKNIASLSFGSSIIGSNGAESIIEYSGAPILDKERHIVGYVFIIRDITIQKKIAEEMIRVQRLESLEMIAGRMAHEFDNVFTVILGNITIAGNHEEKRQNRDKKLADLLEKAEQAALRTKNLTNQLHHFAKSSGPIMKDVSILRLLRRIGKEILEEPDINALITCQWNSPDDLRPLDFNWDEMYIALWNIVKNAAESMPGGGTIEMKLVNALNRENIYPSLHNGDYVKISITDHGSGIEEKMFQKIFDPFFTLKENRPGMGLATAFSIIQKHRGAITLESEVGVGSTFNIFLPAPGTAENTKNAVLQGQTGEIRRTSNESRLSNVDIGRR